MKRFEKRETVDPYQLVSLNDAAKLLRVCRRTVERLVGSGEIPRASKIGGSTRLRRIDLIEYIERKTSPAN